MTDERERTDSEQELENQILVEYGQALASAAEGCLRYPDRMSHARSEDERDHIRREHSRFLARVLDANSIALSVLEPTKENTMKPWMTKAALLLVLALTYLANHALIPPALHLGPISVAGAVNSLIVALAGIGINGPAAWRWLASTLGNPPGVTVDKLGGGKPGTEISGGGVLPPPAGTLLVLLALAATLLACASTWHPPDPNDPTCAPGSIVCNPVPPDPPTWNRKTDGGTR